MSEKKYCRLCKKKETRSQCGFGPKLWDRYSVDDATDKETEEAASESGIAEGNKSGDSSLHDWFNKSKSSDGKKGWVQLGGKYAGKPCAKQPGQTTKPKCGSSKMKRNLDKDEEEAAFRRKNRKDPNPDRKGKAINVNTEETVVEKAGEKDACYKKVKATAKVWPSAYASGRLVQCRKKGASNWGKSSKKEEIELTDAYGDTFAVITNLIEPEPIKVVHSAVEYDTYELEEATRVKAETGNLIHVILTWKGRTYGMKMFFPQVKMPKKSEVQAELEKVYPECRVMYFRIVEKQPGETFLHVSEGAAWTKKSGKSESGGLNEKGRKSYERENPGSDLKAPSKKVGNPRRKSFCARMKGMKKKLTSSKTANDPDSRINKSLRAWNC